MKRHHLVRVWTSSDCICMHQGHNCQSHFVLALVFSGQPAITSHWEVLFACLASMWKAWSGVNTKTVQLSPRAGSLYTEKMLLKKEGNKVNGLKKERRRWMGGQLEAVREGRNTNWVEWREKRESEKWSSGKGWDLSSRISALLLSVNGRKWVVMHPYTASWLMAGWEAHTSHVLFCWHWAVNQLSPQW